MKFFAVNGERPVRMSEQTRKFAFDSMNHRYGKETAATPGVCMDDYPGFEARTPLEKYDAAVAYIAERSPLRICEGDFFVDWV